MKSRIALLVVLLLSTSLVTQTANTYVAIGDSLAFGFQQGKFVTLLLLGQYDPAAFNTGFVDWINAFGQSAIPGFKTVNFSCPGETTTTLVFSGCPMHNPVIALPLHQNYPATTPQIVAALQYLEAHPGEIMLITVTIGANDILGVVSDCNQDATCMGQRLPAATAGATTVLTAVVNILKQYAPGATILYTNVPDPFMFSAPATVPFFQSFNDAMGSAATQAGAKVADWFTGQKQFDQATFCQLTFVCTAPLYDIHPTDLGYKVLAIQAVQALQ